jgi:hypothetical protein
MIKRLLFVVVFSVSILPSMLIGTLLSFLGCVRVLLIWLMTGRYDDEIIDIVYDNFFWWINLPLKLFGY